MLATISSCVTSAPRRSPPPEPAIQRSPASRWIATMLFGEGRLALTRPDDQIGPACDGAGAAAESADRLLEGGGGDKPPTSPVHPPVSRPTRARASSEAADWCPDHVRDGVRDRSRGRDTGRLADPLRAVGPGVRRFRLDPADVDLRGVGRGHELVVEQVRVALAASSSNRVPSVSAWPIPITTPP